MGAPAPALAARFRVYAVDVIGEPGLSAETRPPPGSDRYARWPAAVLDHFGVAEAAFLASSFGGWLALDSATTNRRLEAAGAEVDLLPGTGHYIPGDTDPAFLTRAASHGDFTA
ncbi:alpha/beta fold hydrolase [Amycolatopsis sp. CA-128772]|uniref:alpha/beta fold hydrolase n=1 Tax=Amycolatopsis sp. CA-128772 TaxID=2073159 RepID=UPI001E2BB09E|nr:alpha/beta fold hydrolase [Amycolatopsis sp. CA-128772]